MELCLLQIKTSVSICVFNIYYTKGLRFLHLCGRMNVVKIIMCGRATLTYGQAP